jgi:hypothetical protein
MVPQRATWTLEILCSLKTLLLQMFVLHGLDVAVLAKLLVGHDCQVGDHNIDRSEGTEDALANHASIEHVNPSAACKYESRLDQAAFNHEWLH